MENKYKKYTLAIFANSVKHGQHCIAGKCIETKKWLRPVSNKNGGELSRDQIMYTNKFGRWQVKNLQKIEMSLSHCPLINQPENYLIGKSEWIQKYSLKEHELLDYIDEPENLWGKTDRVDYQCIMDRKVLIKNSLYLVNVEDLKLIKTGSNQRRGRFIYRGISYTLACTDSNFDKIYKNNNYFQNSILCLSLGEAYKETGACHKLIVGIF